MGPLLWATLDKDPDAMSVPDRVKDRSISASGFLAV